MPGERDYHPGGAFRGNVSPMLVLHGRSIAVKQPTTDAELDFGLPEDGNVLGKRVEGMDPNLVEVSS